MQSLDLKYRHIDIKSSVKVGRELLVIKKKTGTGRVIGKWGIK